jgi:hypothetical protein
MFYTRAFCHTTNNITIIHSFSTHRRMSSSTLRLLLRRVALDCLHVQEVEERTFWLSLIPAGKKSQGAASGLLDGQDISVMFWSCWTAHPTSRNTVTARIYLASRKCWSKAFALTTSTITQCNTCINTWPNHFSNRQNCRHVLTRQRNKCASSCASAPGKSNGAPVKFCASWVFPHSQV